MYTAGVSEANFALEPAQLWSCCTGGATLAADSGLDPALSSQAADAFSIAIVGDLHLEQKGMQTFHRARQQLKGVLQGKDAGEARVVQLGDLGGYNEKPGTRHHVCSHSTSTQACALVYGLLWLMPAFTPSIKGLFCSLHICKRNISVS